MNRIPPRVYEQGIIKNVVLGDSSHIAVVEGNSLKVYGAANMQTEAACLESIELPGPAFWMRDQEGKVKEIDSEQSKVAVEVMEIAINPVLPVLSANRICMMTGGGHDPLRDVIMRNATICLMAHEDVEDDKLAKEVGAEWACRVYWVFNMVIPADSSEEPWGPTIGCVAFHHVGLIGG